MGMFDWLFGKKAEEPRKTIEYGAAPKEEDRIAELCRITNAQMRERLSGKAL